MLATIYGGIVNIVKNYKLFLLCIILLGCSDQSEFESVGLDVEYASSKKPTIVDGHLAKHSSWPVTVGLIKETGSLFCTGTLIKPQLVLTAAHCVIGKFGETIHIIYGCDDANKCSKNYRINVVSISIYPGYQRNTKPWHDVALVLLAEPIYQNSNITLLDPKLYDTVLKLEKQTTLVGYGRISDKGPSGKLYFGHAPIILKNDYEIRIGKNDDTTSNVCYGDSGSSFYVTHNNKYYVTGIASRLVAKNKDTDEWCGGGSIYTLPGEYMTWINTEYNDMLDALSKSNHLTLHSNRCSISHAPKSNIHITLFILFMFYIRKRKII
tara:strand:- start:2883 stop:3854 length:972 start_codon:yes stop_codon:yes gene_type:complete